MGTVRSFRLLCQACTVEANGRKRHSHDMRKRSPRSHRCQAPLRSRLEKYHASGGTSGPQNERVSSKVSRSFKMTMLNPSALAGSER